MNKSDDIIWLSPWSKLKKNKINFSGLEFISHVQKNLKNIHQLLLAVMTKQKNIPNTWIQSWSTKSLLFIK